MSNLVKVLYDVADIRGRYLCVHDEIFRVSALKLVRVFSRDPPDPYAAQESELDLLLQRLVTARSELEALDEIDLSVRRGREIRTQLSDYVLALAESVQALRSISELMRRRAAKDRTYDPKGLQDLKVSYDDSVQHHKRLGARLNALVSSL